MKTSEKISRQRLIAEFWRRGVLDWKLHSGQSDIHAFILDLERRKKKKGVIRTARRFGKTYELVTFANERCIRSPCRIPFAAPTIKQVKKIVIPIFNEVLSDCPKALRPKFRAQDGVYEYPNGSEVHLAGTDKGNAEKLRGIKAEFALLDEAGFMTDLKTIVHDIMLPTLMYGDGFLLATSTPPTSGDHYFVELLAEAEADGCAIKKTIWQNPRLAIKEIIEFADATGCDVDWDRFNAEHCPDLSHSVEWGMGLIKTKSIHFRREFEAEILVDPDRAVIPEFTEENESDIVTEWKRPAHCFKYTVIDTGFVDRTGVIFGYWDFENAKAIVEDDLLIDFRGENVNIESLATRIRAKEVELWGEERPYSRYGDGDLIVLNELSRYGLTVSPVRKDELEAQVNQVRIDIQRDKLRIQPRAKNAIAHAKYATWNKRRNQFERSETEGHFDCLAALIYFLRHLNRNQNPFPKLYGVDIYNSRIYEEKFDDDASTALRRLIGR